MSKPEAGQARPIKLLLLARHYPPAVSGGARRPYHLAHALARAGVDVTVAAPDPDPNLPSIPIPHPNRDPAPDTAGAEPSFSDRFKNLAREWALWPDPDIRWSMQAAERIAGALISAPDWILTTSPPESVHVAGAALKRASGARWCADFRDQWFERAFRRIRRNPVRRSIESRLARHWLSTVDCVTGVNAAILAETAAFTEHLASTQRRVLPHFAIPRPAPSAFKGAGPHFVHTGSFSLSDPECAITPLLTAFEAAWRDRPSSQLHLFGRLSPEEVSAIAASPATSGVIMHGVVSHSQALAAQQAATALAVVAAPNALVPPGKYSEYLSAGRPIIALGNQAWTEGAGLGDGEIGTAARAMAAYETLKPPSSALITADDAARELLSLLAGEVAAASSPVL